MPDSLSAAYATQPRFHLGYRPALDGIRGVAVLMVTAGHLKVSHMQYGFLGVDVFFTLSGFLITTILVEEWIRTGRIQLRNFYFRRILRLYPALLLMLILVSPLTKAHTYILSGLTYTTNWVMAFGILPINLELGHIWTLAIEEQYYLLWPIALIFLLKRFRPAKIFLILTGLAAISFAARVFYWGLGADFWRYNAGTDTHADGLLLGSALGIITVFRLAPTNATFKRWVTIGGVTGFSLVALFAFIWPIADMETTLAFGSLAVAFTTLYVIARIVIFPSRLLLAFLGSKPIAFVGMISYGLYLWQVPVLNLINLQSFSLSPLQKSMIWTVTFLCITLLSYRYLEQPIMRLKARFAPG